MRCSIRDNSPEGFKKKSVVEKGVDITSVEVVSDIAAETSLYNLFFEKRREEGVDGGNIKRDYRRKRGRFNNKSLRRVFSQLVHKVAPPPHRDRLLLSFFSYSLIFLLTPLIKSQ